MNISQQMIATRVGVSRTAVTHVLNGRGHMVGTDVRERIIKILDECDYHRNSLIRGLHRRRTNVIGLVVNSASGYFGHLIASAETAAKNHGYQCFLCQSQGSADSMEKEISTLREYRVDGLILMPVNEEQPETYLRLQASQVPFVLMDKGVEGVSASLVQVDNVKTGLIATRHLIELGHRRIACLRGSPTASDARRREEGYRLALADAGLPVDEELVAGGGYDLDAGREAIRELMTRNTEFTAFFAANDVVACGAIRELRRHGRRVPEDVSAVGVGNDDSCEWVMPSLTSVDQKPGEIGRTAFELLLAQMDRKSSPPARTILVKPELVARGSSIERVNSRTAAKTLNCEKKIKKCEKTQTNERRRQ